MCDLFDVQFIFYSTIWIFASYYQTSKFFYAYIITWLFTNVTDLFIYESKRKWEILNLIMHGSLFRALTRFARGAGSNPAAFVFW